MLNKIFNLGHISAGFSAVLIGYTSSVIIIIQAATAAGASAAHITSWLLSFGLAMGITSIGFSWIYKKPILTAWSTPGAAMLAVILDQYALSEALGAFVVTGILITLTGFIKPLIRLLESIPQALASAMLAAIILPFCIKAFTPMEDTPFAATIMFLTFFLTKKYLPRYTMLSLILIAVGYAIYSGSFINQNIELTIARHIWVSPQFDLLAILNISIPLYLLAMLSQNLPGIALLKSHEYKPPVKSILIGTGITTSIFAPFGVFSINLAAISAAMVMDENVDPDKDKRYHAAIWAGVFYLFAGVWANVVVGIFLALPASVGHMLAGLALITTLLNCLSASFKTESYKEAALFTFLITLSGINLFGIGATTLGILIGGLYKKFHLS